MCRALVKSDVGGQKPGGGLESPTPPPRLHEPYIPINRTVKVLVVELPLLSVTVRSKM